jgi:beta-glucosidase
MWLALVVASAMAVPVVAHAAPRARPGDQGARTHASGFAAPKVRAAQAPSATPSTWDTDPAVEQRVNQIVGQMTTEEKADLATGQSNSRYGFYNNPIARVGIPAQTMADGPIGVRIANPAIDKRATRMPSGTAMGATFDPALLSLVGQTIGNEAFHTGHNVQLGPSVDIPRSPMWGRAFEGYGEDPLLTGLLAGRYIGGIQSNPVLATIKHFVGYTQETDRFTYTANPDERTLREIYAKPYELGVRDGKPGAAMCSFNKINGVYACENPLMNTLLKDALAFHGFIMSDYNATPSTAQAANNGLDQEQPGDQGPGSANFGARLVAAVNAGQVSMDRLNDMARRILRPMVGLGLFEHPVQTDRFDEQAHAQVARRVAQEGTVLLKNDRRALPLGAGGGRPTSIAVIGPDADNTSAQGGGSAVIPKGTTEVSPLDGIRNRAGSGATVTYAPGVDGISEGDLLPGPAPVPSSVLHPAGGAASDRGLRAQYWPNTTFSGQPKLDLVDPNVNVNLGFATWFSAASPKSGAAATAGALGLQGDFALTGDLSARWTGEIVAPQTGDYRLGLTARGDARLLLDGAPFVQHAGPLSSEGKTVHLVAGQSRPVQIEYSAPKLNMYQGGQVRLFWEHAEDAVPPAMRDAVANARAADAAVVVVRDYETEGGSRQADRPSLDLPKEQDQLIRQVARANPRTIVVVETGSPSKTSTWDQRVAAILQAWFPGQEQGNALAALLFGDVNPSGKLPVTIPQDETQVPPIETDNTVEHTEGVFVGYRAFQQNGLRASYPFGYGLSYTSFRYRNLQVDDGSGQRGGNGDGQSGDQQAQAADRRMPAGGPNRCRAGARRSKRHHGHRRPCPAPQPGPQPQPQGDITVSFDLGNGGARSGAEVAQVYIGRLPTAVPTPPRQLAGFARVDLQPGQSQRVTVTIPRRSLSYWDTTTHSWATPTGQVPVYVGGSSEDAELTGVIDVR